MYVWRRRPGLAQVALTKDIERTIDWISWFNQPRAPIILGEHRYDSAGQVIERPRVLSYEPRLPSDLPDVPWLAHHPISRRAFVGGSLALAATILGQLSMPRRAAGQVWAPPIGIPDPTWGISSPTMPSLPSPWTAGVAGFYYVKQGGTNVQGGVNGNGWPANPRGTIPGTVPAGAVVVIDNTATFSLPTSFTTQGTVGSPCFVVGSSLSASNRAQLNCGGDTGINGTYCVMEWVNFRPISGGSFFIAFQGNADHIAIRNSAITGIAGSQPTHAAMQLFSYLGNFTRTNIVFYNNAFLDLGLVATTNDVDAHGIKTDSGASDIWIVDNTFDRIGGDSVQMGPQGLGAANDWTNNHVYVGRNVTQGNRQSGYWVKHARDVVISQNTAFNQNGGAAGATTPGTGAGLQEGADRVWYLYNHFYDIGAPNGLSGINMLQNLTAGSPEGNELYAIGNVIHDFTSGGSLGMQGQPAISDAIYIFNNTIFSVAFGIYHRNNNPRHVVWDNIIDNCASAPLLFDGGTVQAGSSWRSNLLAPDTSTIASNFEGANRTFAQFVAQAGARASGNINVNPTYTDPNNANHGLRNYKLVAGSNGIDAGRDPNPADAGRQNPYARFLALYGLSIAVDFNGLARPQNGVWDIGAYEFASGGTPPAAPSNLRII